MKRILLCVFLSLAGLQARAEEPRSLFGENGLPDDTFGETVRLGFGGGLNLTPAEPGWQAGVSVMGENREKALLTQISLSWETVGTQAAGESSPSGRVSQVTLNPLSLFFGFGGVRVGGGFDLSWSFLPSGQSAQNATGFGWGGRAGGGIVVRPGPLNLWALCQYRWLSGDRVGGLFFDLFIGPD